MPPTIPDEQFLDAALEVLVQRGYAGATTREIAEVAEVNEVTLFRRFGSKSNLLSAAVEREAKAFEAAGVEYTGDLEADLLRVVRFYQQLVRKRGELILMLLAEGPRQSELREVMKAPFAVLARIALLIERYQDDGQLVAEPPFKSVVTLLGPLIMDRLAVSFGPAPGDELLDPEEHLRLFLDGRRQI